MYQKILFKKFNKYSHFIMKLIFITFLISQPRVKFDFPPGGFPEYFTDVKAPAACISSGFFCSSSCFYFAASWAALALLPHLSSSPPSCPRLKLLAPPGWWWTLTEVVPSLAKLCPCSIIFIFENLFFINYLSMTPNYHLITYDPPKWYSITYNIKLRNAMS